MFFFVAILTAFMIYVLLMVLCTTFKIVIRMIKRKLSTNNVHDVSIYINIIYNMYFFHAEYYIFLGFGQTSRSRDIKSDYWDKQI